MEVNLCPDINSGQASCSVKCQNEEVRDLMIENEAVVNLEHSVTVVYQHHDELMVKIIHPENTDLNSENENCAKENPDQFHKLPLRGEPSKVLNDQQPCQRESTKECLPIGTSYITSTCSLQTNLHSTARTYLQTENTEVLSSCPLCASRYVTSKDLNEHLKTHCEKETKCPVCDKILTSRGSLFGHLRTHSGHKPYKCKTCSKAFKAQYQLVYHECVCGLGIAKPYKCRYCDKSFNVPISRLIHERVHANEDNDLYSKTFNQKGEVETHACGVVNIHKTSSCNEKFPDKEQLLPQRSHENYKGYVCSHCNKAFRRQSNLDIHTRIHTGIKPYKCTQCFKAFTRNDHLKNHIRIHTSTKPFQCLECNKTFSNVNRLVLHKRTHTGSREYRCNVCHMTFPSYEDFRSHKTTHASGKPYICTYCEKKFARPDHLRNHERVHTGVKPFKCSFCEKVFARQDHLKNHERIHTGLKPYVCKHCGKAFTRLGNLQTHERIHTGVKPYTCAFCQKNFSRLDYLKSHERALHMINSTTHSKTTTA